MVRCSATTRSAGCSRRRRYDADRPRARPKLAVWKFASCDGCQLSLLDCEDELLAVAGAIDIAYFPEATRGVVKGRYDLSLVEGSITTAARRRTNPRRARALPYAGHHRRLRDRRRHPGAAQLGGRGRVCLSRVCAARLHPDFATSTSIADHVAVDFELRGCPINKHQLLEVMLAMLAGRRPITPPHSVCIECKLKGNVCVMVAHGTPCLGPVTHAGCGAICPSYDRGCYGCLDRWKRPTRPRSAAAGRLGMDDGALMRVYRTFNANAAPFREESERHDG